MRHEERRKFGGPRNPGSLQQIRQPQPRPQQVPQNPQQDRPQPRNTKQISEFAELVLSGFRKHNQRNLRKINDEILDTAVMESNKTFFHLAVYAYVLSKIVSKPRYLNGDYSKNLRDIESALVTLSSRRGPIPETEIHNSFTRLEKAIGSLESQDPRFITNMLTKGRLKMAAIMYAKGMSLGVASDTTGLQKQEILDYAGQTMMFDRLREEVGILERMKIARHFLEE